MPAPLALPVEVVALREQGFLQSAIAEYIGTEVVFSKAFKRYFGMVPGAYRQAGVN